MLNSSPTSAARSLTLRMISAARSGPPNFLAYASITGSRHARRGGRVELVRAVRDVEVDAEVLRRRRSPGRSRTCACRCSTRGTRHRSRCRRSRSGAGREPVQFVTIDHGTPVSSAHHGRRHRLHRSATRLRPADVQATFCATLVDEWIRLGVRHAVVAPGSRSTPMALALADRSDLARPRGPRRAGRRVRRARPRPRRRPLRCCCARVAPRPRTSSRPWSRPGCRRFR